MSWIEGDGGFLRELVECRSESGDEESCCVLLSSRLLALGWESVVRDEVGNVVASRGTGPRELLMMGHIDTVPGGPKTEVEGDVLWGRGSVDAKGPLASFSLAGGRAIVPDGWRYTLIAAVGEERDSRGARYVMDSRKAPMGCIIGEPSGGDGVTLAYRGCLFLSLEASDGGAHRSGGSGPLTETLSSASEILRMVESMDEDGPIVRRYSAAVASMYGVEKGERHASIDLDVRLPLGADPSSLARSFQEICSARAVDMSVRQSVSAHMSDRRDPVVRALSTSVREEGLSPRLLAKGGTADFNVVAPWGVPMAAYGPGDSGLDHGPDERLSIGELKTAIRVLERALPRACLFLGG